MPGGQAGDDEKAELVTVGQVELRWAGQALVALGQLLFAHPEPAVLNLEDEAAGRRLPAHADRGVRRGGGGGCVRPALLLPPPPAPGPPTPEDEPAAPRPPARAARGGRGGADGGVLD